MSMNIQELHKLTGKIALVAVEKALYSYDLLYSYVVPYELEAVVSAGKRVTVPFGFGKRKLNGMVFSVEEKEYEPASIKKISEVIDDDAYMTPEMLNLAIWLKENTFCTYYNAVRCILPPVLRNTGKLPKDKTEKIVRLTGNETEDKLTPKQKSVLDALENNTASVKEICYLCSVSSSVVTTLIKKGLLEELVQAPTLYDADKAAQIYRRDVSDIILTDEQEAAFNSLINLFKSGEARCALLHGITGSGKTSVFIKLTGDVLKTGKSALILVPEISLTPQTIAIFKGFFGDNAAVIHSGLSMSKRTEEYKRIRAHQAKIVIGTRSAVFAPLDNIGIIVIDEEGEQTYKSERSPRYHVRDIAKQRCFKHNALLLLASATPSMDSYQKAQIGKYTLLELTNRYSGNNLPSVYIVDMKLERTMGNNGNFSEALLKGLRQNLENGEQSLILLNRRGYYTYVCCVACGEVAKCPNCGIALTYHKTGDNLCCHYCGFIQYNTNKCGKCGSRFVRSDGTGTQRVEDELQELFPTARILRMDADTTMTKGAYERGFGSFGNNEYDIMVGTQMIAKGLDFPNVTLVGILLIDNSLYAGDYLGYEQTFSLITQVVGRSGRGDKKGRAFLQTFTPDHYVLRLAARQDYRGFFDEEAAIRKTLLFPPFCDLCIAEICNVIEKGAVEAAKAFINIIEEELKQISPIPIRVLGPVKNGAGSINGRFRYRVIIKCRNSPVFRGVIKRSLIKAHTDKRFEHCRVGAWFDNS
ncbi:MAG: primosomal protein N' [Oscillospiraceae bacterium]|nr:primosomal protein N' [Oscillospiraceae bacterium]